MWVHEVYGGSVHLVEAAVRTSAHFRRRLHAPTCLLLLGAVTFIDGFSKVVAQKIANG